MKKSAIEIGRRYTAKVSGKVVVVRIQHASPYGGWIAVNEGTHREVRIRSARRLRAPLGEPIYNINFGGTTKREGWVIRTEEGEYYAGGVTQPVILWTGKAGAKCFPTEQIAIEVVALIIFRSCTFTFPEKIG